MQISLSVLIEQFITSSSFRLVVLLVAGVIVVNGWTDAPNAIASCVSTGAMELRKAIKMAALFNFAGLLVVSAVNTKVAFTITRIVDFGNNSEKALIALCAAMAAIILWACAAWLFGIPTSESHALIAAMTGAAIALRDGMAGVRMEEWGKVLWGLVSSVLFGYVFGMVTTRLLSHKKGSETFYTRAQIAGGAAMSFMHGAQDGQKFMGIFMMGIYLVNGWVEKGSFLIPFWMMAMCAILIAAGTALGGKRIIQKVGSEMVALKKYQGFSSDLAAAGTLLLCSVMGLPVSTTHVKTTAMMGAGSVEEGQKADRRVVIQMITAWVLTFPCCGGIGYVMAKLFMILLEK